MVRGAAIAVTKVAGRYQCAETHSTARGRGISFPIAAQPFAQALCIKAFIGLPCPKKIAGIGFVILLLLASFELPLMTFVPRKMQLAHSSSSWVTTVA